MNNHRVIMLYGFAGIGKSTLAKKLNDDIPFSLNIEVDNVLNMIGQWIEDEEKARKHVFSLAKSMVRNYLLTNNDVIIPYVLFEPIDADELEEIAREANAEFIELFIFAEKRKSINYLLERGTWGESDSIQITSSDIPHIEDLYSQMELAMKSRKNIRRIAYVRNNIDKTYLNIQKALALV